MSTLTLRDLGFVGGLSGGYTITDADAAAWVASVEGASGDNQPLEDAIKQAVDTYVQSLKSNNVWTSAAQLLLPCGPRTLAGALRPLKGAVPTNGSGSAGSTQFTSGNYNRKNGLGDAANTAKYLNSNTSKNNLSLNSHALMAYGSISATTGDKILIGSYSTSNPVSILTLDEWAPGASPAGRALRSNTDSTSGYAVSSSTSPVTCLIGSRTASNAAALYPDGATITNAFSTSGVTSSLPLYYYSLNVNNSPATYSPAILQATGIFSAGLNATQAAALRTATATYVAAVAAAIP